MWENTANTVWDISAPSGFLAVGTTRKRSYSPMKASGKFLSAASAVALSAGLVVPPRVAVQFAFVSVAQAAVVSSIEVQGNQRVDDETIIGYLDIAPGKSFSSADIDEAVKRLFAHRAVLRRPHQPGRLDAGRRRSTNIRSSTRCCSRATRSSRTPSLAGAVQLKPRGPFSHDTLNADVEAIKAAYTRIGRDDAQVTTQIIDVGEGRVNVVFEINEGGRTKISAVNFNGNDAYSDRRLSATSSRPSARRSCPISCATTSMPRTGCGPTRRRCAASTTITAMPISG